MLCFFCFVSKIPTVLWSYGPLLRESMTDRDRQRYLDWVCLSLYIFFVHIVSDMCNTDICYVVFFFEGKMPTVLGSYGPLLREWMTDRNRQIPRLGLSALVFFNILSVTCVIQIYYVMLYLLQGQNTNSPLVLWSSLERVDDRQRQTEIPRLGLSVVIYFFCTYCQ